MTSNKLYIFYPVGTYGSWLAWMISFAHDSLHTLTNPDPVQSDGSAHNYQPLIHDVSTYHPIGINAIMATLGADVSHLPLAVIRAMPGPDDQGDRNEIINYVAQHHRVIRILCEDEDDYDIALLNSMYKIRLLWRQSIPAETFTKWNADAKSIDDLEPWEERELFSLFFPRPMESFYESKIELDGLIQTVTVKEILSNDVEGLIAKIFSRFGFPLNDDAIGVIRNEHQKLISLQQSVSEISTIQNIVSAIQQGIDIQFDKLSLYAESILQRRLRQKGYNLQCYNLNELPTSTAALHKLLVL